MARFDQCAAWVIYQEDDHAKPGAIKNLGDGGKLTRLGVTQAHFGTLVDPTFFTSMPFDQALKVAKGVFEKYFWNPFAGNLIGSDFIAAPMLSFAVNSSVERSVRALQKVLGLREDGIVGVNTLFTVNSKDAVSTAELFRAEWKNYYHEVVDMNPLNLKFLNGWLNRASFPYPYDIPVFYLEGQ